MDGKRFDSLAKSLASWSSRRRFLSGVTGAAAAGALFQTKLVSAQSPFVPDTCVPHVTDFSDKVRSDISTASQTLLKQLQNSPTLAAMPDTTMRNGPQFVAFLQQVECLLGQGATATDWQDKALLGMYLNQLGGIITSMSVAYTGAFFSEGQGSIDSGGVHALREITKSQVCGHGNCIADALNDAFTCLAGCSTDETCTFTCFSLLVTDLLLGTAGPSKKDPCLPGLAPLCKGDCCLSNCIGK